MKGIDYSWSRPGGAAIKAAGFEFVCRYCPYPGDGGKGLTEDELADLHANGLGVVLVYESTAGRMFDGYPAGKFDAVRGLSAMRRLGFPEDRPLYFACDVDTQPEMLALVDDYLNGCASVLGVGRVGVYGEYDVVDHCWNAASASWAWQTYAWSSGRKHEWNHIYQYLNGQTLNDSAVDYNESYGDDFGQWEVGMTPDERAKLDAVYAALTGGVPGVIEAWNENGNSVLVAYNDLVFPHLSDALAHKHKHHGFTGEPTAITEDN